MARRPPGRRADAPWGGAGILDCLKHGAQGGRGDDVLWGGDGGAAWDVDFSITGHNGMSDTQPFGGWGGQNPGQSGGQGAAGQPGVAGAGGSAILNRAATLYAAADGADGTDGARGEGGGGGAGSSEPCVVGAGGGAGGRPGSGGHGGHGGGGSIGLFVGGGAHALVLDGSSIQTSNGGKGGWGPAGQPGGAGGIGGPAASTIISGHYYQAGAGGNGGYGGQGGQGGGGAGGASVGVLAIDARAVVAPDTQITVGPGGAGGHGRLRRPAGRSRRRPPQVTTAGGSVPALGDFDGDGIDDAADTCPIAARGSGTGCPAPVRRPGRIRWRGDPTATAAGSTTSGSGAVAVSVLPASSCVAKRVFTIRINARKAHIKTARLTIDGRRLKLVKRSPRRWTAKIDLRHSTRTTAHAHHPRHAPQRQALQADAPLPDLPVGGEEHPHPRPHVPIEFGAGRGFLAAEQHRLVQRAGHDQPVEVRGGELRVLDLAARPARRGARRCRPARRCVRPGPRS